MSELPPLTPPDGDRPSEPPSHRPRRLWKILVGLGLGLGSLVTVGGVVFYVWGDRLVTNLLLPRVAETLDETIKRPVEIGDVEGFSFWGVKLGETVIPPTETDASSVTVDGIEISIGLRSLLFQRTLKSKVVLIRPAVSLIENENGQWLELTLPEPSEAKQPIELEIESIEVQGASLSAVPYVEAESEAVVPREPIQIKETDARVEFFGESAQEATFELDGEVVAAAVDTAANQNGRFVVNGAANLETQTVKANARLTDLPSVGANVLFPDSLGLRSGELNGNLTAEADFEDGVLDQSSLDVTGTAQFQNGEFVVGGLPVPTQNIAIQNIGSDLVFKGQRVSVEDASLQLNDITLLAEGDVDLDSGYDLTAQIPAVSVDQVQSLVDVDLPVPVEGSFEVVTQVLGELESPVLEGQLTSGLASAQPLLIDKVALETVEADFALRLPNFQPNRFDLNELRARPAAGGEIVAGGTADLSDLENLTFQLEGQTDLPVDGLAQTYGASLPEGIVLGRLNADFEGSGSLEDQVVTADWQLSEGTFAGSGEVALADNVVALENAQLRSQQGTATAAATLSLESREWQATANTDRVAVSQFTDKAKGLLTAEIEASGNLDALDLNQIDAKGTAVVADAQALLTENGVPLLEPGDWTTAFALVGSAATGSRTGSAIAVENFTAPGLQADGTIGIDLSKTIPIGDIALNVALQDYDLRRLNRFAPANVTNYAQLNGLTRFNGQLSGTLETLTLSGNAQLNNLAVNDLLFEPLSGPVNFALATGGQLDFRGQQDRLQLTLQDSPEQALPYWPVAFEVRSQDLIANGTTEGDLLRAQVVQLPLERLAIRPPAQYGLGSVGGTLAANLNVNLASLSNPTAAGTVVVTQPSLDPVEAQQLNATFTYAGGTATLNEGELLFEEGRYLLNGRASLGNNISDISYQGDLSIEDGRIEDFIPLLESIDFSAFGAGDAQEATGSAADLATQPVGVPEGATFLAKLERFKAFLEANPDLAETDAIAQNPNTLGNTALPSLDQLKGAFTGTVTVAGSSLAVTDAAADFDIQGNRWQWGDNTPPNEFSLSGDVAQGKVNIDTAFVNAGKTAIDLTAKGDLEQLNGQLVVENLPVAVAQLFYPLPADITGDLALNTTFGGSLSNPVVQGEALVTNAQINNYSLEGITADFTYRNAALDLDSAIAVESGIQPITVKGTIPYALPFATVSPPTNQLNVVADVPNGNLALINALTDDNVVWQSGQGEVVMTVGGTLSQPTFAGQASFRDGALSSPLLEDEVTSINGDIAFDLQQVNIQQLQAAVGEGQVAVSGRLPLLLSGETILPQLGARSLVENSLGQNSLAANSLVSNSLVSNSLVASSAPGFYQAQQPAPTEQPAQTVDDSADGLVIALDNLPVNYENALEAVFNGRMFVTGALLSPTISGDVEIDAGEVHPNNLLSQASSLNFPTTEVAQPINAYRADYLDIDPTEVASKAPQGIVSTALERVALSDLNLRFGDRLSIIGQPLYNITADGELVVNGTLSNLQPDGTINLSSGWINLFSTQFRLDRTEPHSATFTPENGLDPFVNLVMLARVQESDITPAPPPPGGFANAEVNESQLETTGDVQFISVRAIAQGPASDISNSLMLTSRPVREQGELLALLGSNVVGGLASASLTQIGSFVGSGTLATLGNRVADAVGLQSFSVFPTTDTGDDSSVEIGIAVEASAAIGDRFNINFLEVLNSSDPPQLGVLYRFTDELSIRGASNSELEDTDFEVEYRIDF